MQSNRPKVYGYCDAGCKREVPSKDNFLSFTHDIGVNDWDGSDAPFSHQLIIDRLVDEDVVIVDVPISAVLDYGFVTEQRENSVIFSVTTKPIDKITVKIAVIPSTAVVEI